MQNDLVSQLKARAAALAAQQPAAAAAAPVQLLTPDLVSAVRAVLLSCITASLHA